MVTVYASYDNQSWVEVATFPAKATEVAHLCAIAYSHLTIDVQMKRVAIKKVYLDENGHPE
jgi:hypothetical protein